MPVALDAWFSREGRIPRSALETAVARQSIYGGSLDTAILERGLMAEAALWAGLAEASGLPPPPESLFTAPLPVPPPPLDAEATGPLRTVPVGVEGNTVTLLCGAPFHLSAIREVAARHGLETRLFVVPEVRLLAIREVVYGEPLPARYAPLLRRRPGRGVPERPGAEAAAWRREGAATSAPLPAATATAKTVAPAAPMADGAPTPLERFMDLSGGLLTGSSAPEGEVEVEIELAGGEPDQALSGTASLPVRLEVVSSAVLTEVPAPDGGGAGGGENHGAAELPGEPGGDSATDALCRRARDRDDKGRLLALRALRQRFTHPATQALLRDLRSQVLGEFPASASSPEASAAPAAGQEETVSAIDALAELRDATVVPGLVDWLIAPSSEVAAAAHRALVDLCAQDFGRSARRWRAWVKAKGARPRTEWLLDGLAHKDGGIRAAAAEELRQLAGHSFDYDPHAPRGLRDQARRRFVAWWEATSLARRPAVERGAGESPPDEPLAGERSPGFSEPVNDVPLPPTPKAR